VKQRLKGGSRQGLPCGRHVGVVRIRGLADLHSRTSAEHERRWTDKPAEFQRAVYNNRRRMRRGKGKQLQRRRSELCERSFAHLCDTGGGRRTWLRSLVNVTKRYLIAAAAHNLGRILRKLFGVGKPKGFQGESGVAAFVQFIIQTLVIAVERFSAGIARRRSAALLHARKKTRPKNSYFNGLLGPRKLRPRDEGNAPIVSPLILAIGSFIERRDDSS